MAQITCVVCGASREAPAARDGGARTPRGWKTLRDRPYCPACKHAAFSLRALTIPVAGPEGATWAELRLKLRELWAETTACANWMVTELYARDVRRAPGDTRLAKMPYTYLYPEARQLCPNLSAQSVAALAQDVLRRYRAQRYELLWTRTRSLPAYRYPVACPIPSQAWSLHEDEGRWTVSLRLGDRRWVVRLRGGPHMRLHLQRLGAIQGGEAERGALTIYAVPAPGTSHHGGADARATRVMIKIAAWLPKEARPEGAAIVSVRTARDALLASDGWRIDATPVRGVLAADARRRAGLLTNLRLARAQGRRRCEGIEAALTELSRRSQRRLAEACRTAAAHLAAHAVRKSAAIVRYDDSDRSAFPHFPWEELRRRAFEKLDERGIAFVHVNGHRDDRERPYRVLGSLNSAGKEDAA